MNSVTVKDLKLAVKRKVSDAEQSKMGHRQISWLVVLYWKLVPVDCVFASVESAFELRIKWWLN